MLWICLECSFSLNKLRFQEQLHWTPVGWVFRLRFPQGMDWPWGSQSFPKPPKLTTNCNDHLRRKGRLPRIALFQNLLVSLFTSRIRVSLSTHIFSGYGSASPVPLWQWQIMFQNEVFSNRAPPWHPIHIIPVLSQHLIRAFLSQTPKAPRLLYEKWFHGESVWNERKFNRFLKFYKTFWSLSCADA